MKSGPNSSSTLPRPAASNPIGIGPSPADCALIVNEAWVARIHGLAWTDDDANVRVRACGAKTGLAVDGGSPFRDEERMAQRTIHIGESVIAIERD